MNRAYLLLTLLALLSFQPIYGQPDKSNVRAGYRAFKRGDYERALVENKRALDRDSLSYRAGYNLGNVLHKIGSSKEAGEVAEQYLQLAEGSGAESSFFHNLGNYALEEKEYQAAIEHYKNSLRINPTDMETKSNLAYAQKMLEREENEDQQGGYDQQDKDDQQDQQDQKDQQDQDQKQDKDDQQDQQQDQQITPQGAMQMLKAIENKDRETQDKVNREKALKMERQKREKNW